MVKEFKGNRGEKTTGSTLFLANIDKARREIESVDTVDIIAIDTGVGSPTSS
jgi:hypothetical protein